MGEACHGTDVSAVSILCGPGEGDAGREWRYALK